MPLTHVENYVLNSTCSPSFALLIPASHLGLPSKDEPIRESKRQKQRESISEKADERWRKLGEGKDGGNYILGEGKDGGNSVRKKKRRPPLTSWRSQ